VTSPPARPAAGPAAGPSAEPVAGAWAPLQQRTYRRFWVALLVSNIGTWMQTVGAQWLLVDELGTPGLAPLVQTAATLPVLLLALPAGVLADTFDRRRLLIAVQAAAVSVCALLAALTAAGRTTPALLLTLTFLLGCTAALTAPAYQATIPDIVPRDQLPAAAALGSANMNMARAIGPAVAGALIAQVGVAAAFGVNAFSFLAFLAVLLAWPGLRTRLAHPPERFTAALRAGSRYVRNSRVVRRILLRLGLFVAPASALWALLPLVATQRLGLGSQGYGLLLGAVGAGAAVGALLLPRLRRQLGPNLVLTLASVVYAAALVGLVATPSPAVAAIGLVPAGAAWVGVLSTMNASLQLFLPTWVRARGLSIYQMVFFGAQALGGVVWGLAAELLGVVTACGLAAATLALGAASMGVLPLCDAAGLGRDLVSYWPEPQVAVEPTRDVGPVLVTSEYVVAAERQEAFVAAMRAVERSRRRTGAYRWRLYQDAAHPHRFVEAFLVASWGEHLRQHEGRLTAADEVIERRAIALTDGEPVVSHLFPAGALTPPAQD